MILLRRNRLVLTLGHDPLIVVINSGFTVRTIAQFVFTPASYKTVVLFKQSHRQFCSSALCYLGTGVTCRHILGTHSLSSQRTAGARYFDLIQLLRQSQCTGLFTLQFATWFYKIMAQQPGNKFGQAQAWETKIS
jgi:hypothetical protein